MSKDIIPFEHHKVDGLFPVPDQGKRTPNTCKAIYNAWNKNTVIDYVGKPWVNAKCLHTILRTSPSVARFLVERISEKYKKYSTCSTYIRGDQVLSCLAESIINAGCLNREGFLRYSEELYRAIVDCDKAMALRAAYYESLKTQMRKLKSNRMKSLKCNFDELTDEPLGGNAEFSHIRSVAAYPELAVYQENGLIVNKETHKIITNNKINHENDLFVLCMEMGWSVSWKGRFQAFLVDIGY